MTNRNNELLKGNRNTQIGVGMGAGLALAMAIGLVKRNIMIGLAMGIIVGGFIVVLNRRRNI